MGGHGGLNILPQKRWNGELHPQTPWLAPAAAAVSQRQLLRMPRLPMCFPFPSPQCITATTG